MTADHKPATPLLAGSDPRFTLRVWQFSLLSFIVAAATGLLIRYAFLHGFPFGLVFSDIRHAHSHLMFYGWATPVLMLLMLQFQGDRGSAAVKWLLSYTLFWAFASYVPFLLSGYGLMSVFGRELPLSMMISGLSGLAWLVFIGVYLLRDRKRQPASADRFFRAAILLLLFSSAAVAALAFVGVSGAGAVLINALAFLYLELFAEGWFGIALLGVAWRLFPAARETAASRTGLVLLVLGLTVRSVADVFVKTGWPALEVLVFAGSGLAGLGLLLVILPLWRVLAGMRPGLWHLSLGLLSVKAAVHLLLAIPQFSAWSSAAGLDVFYLHAFLLGALSIGLIAAVRDAWNPAWFRLPWLFSFSVLVMIAALIPLSGVWPASWTGLWVLRAAMWTSAGPVVVALIALFLYGKAEPDRPTRG